MLFKPVARPFSSPCFILHISDTISGMDAIVLLSGGQDSATCLAMACHDHSQVHCICFDYGQRHRIEIESSKQLANRAKATFQLIDVSFLASISSSAMVNQKIPIQSMASGLPNTFLPARNALFLTIAGTIAYERGCDEIYTGVCQTDYSGYPDCRNEFIKSQQQTLQLAMDTNIVIKAPLMHLTKAQTVLEMDRLGCLDWYALSHTCYEGQRPACGQCPSCQLRLNGFKQAGIRDPLHYLEAQ